MMRQPRIGLLPFYLKLYDDTFPELRYEFDDPLIKAILEGLEKEGVETVMSGICRLAPEFRKAIHHFEQEDVDLIGLSILSGAHTYSFPRVLELLKENQAEDITVIGGGIFPLEDIPRLKEIGIKEIFEPGAKLQDITAWVRDHVKPREALTA